MTEQRTGDEYPSQEIINNIVSGNLWIIFLGNDVYIVGVTGTTDTKWNMEHTVYHIAYYNAKIK